MESTRTAVLALAAAIAWQHRDPQLLVATLILGLRVPVVGIELDHPCRWPLGVQLLGRAYH